MVLLTSLNSEVRGQIMEEIRLIDPNLKNKKLYADDMLKNLQFMKNEDLLVSNLLDPRSILISDNLEDSCIFQCKELYLTLFSCWKGWRSARKTQNHPQNHRN